MYTLEKKQMEKISSYAGQRKDYVQGGGGNTSVKFDDRLMAIKASGYTLKEVTEEKGYVTVDYPRIRQYYNEVDLGISKDYEKESLGVNLDSVVLLDGMENKRPSVEVGFHSFLKKCVVHTHSVYANILCCSQEGRQIAQKIFEGDRTGYLFIPYIDPGFRLTFAIKDALDGTAPDVLFLENHGVIAHGDDDSEAIEIHEAVNERIRSYFGITNFPQPKIKQTPDGYASDTDFLKAFLKENSADEAYFNALRLYPDQLVYIGSKMGDTISISGGEIAYKTGEKEAGVIEETLLGIAFIINTIQKAGLTLRQMDEKGVQFIHNWESEKYRSKLIK